MLFLFKKKDEIREKLSMRGPCPPAATLAHSLSLRWPWSDVVRRRHLKRLMGNFYDVQTIGTKSHMSLEIAINLV